MSLSPLGGNPLIWWYVEYDCGKSDRFRVLFQLPVQVVLSNLPQNTLTELLTFARHSPCWFLEGLHYCITIDDVNYQKLLERLGLENG